MSEEQAAIDSFEREVNAKDLTLSTTWHRSGQFVRHDGRIVECTPKEPVAECVRHIVHSEAAGYFEWGVTFECGHTDLLYYDPSKTERCSECEKGEIPRPLPYEW